ncbi:uncharacterized protein LOC111716356 [Eurytemora carolleeae]|uniref:uncharacterized protein LOC111716356 n=1 Tax=Eurytemora carolleeae TaxID=1294199 RepID=UPI000C758A6D|nr:uncharacterized protein LOC111716356 [Eurytemora carolleeae]|eukprot:XP_023347561.1 uncharacterized protein LOC111716356 [Eurytemora affinis]
MSDQYKSANVLDICNCTTIIISSSNPSTISIHSGELGQYTLVGVKAGRPFYKHTSNRFFLYYHEGRGGNWLVNETPGLVYGGIQNSKDYPICPYLLSTVWQYGDSKLEGWVYDTSLQVTCPEDPCSILKCGFRAQCQITSGRASCICRPGYTGNPYTRCYPNLGSCTCKHLHLSTTGPALVHQRDKIGDYYLWGEYNEKPVYQHYSGLDFIYFHKNQVWGVGPKVGGKKVGLLNFSMVDCPYTTKEIWQYGTQNPGDLRQLDTLLKLECVE